METDGFDEGCHYAVTVKIKGDEIECDFNGTSDQQPRGINCVMAYTSPMTCSAIKSLLLPNWANNAGLFRPICAVAPEGSLLNPKFPPAVGDGACTGHYVPIVFFGAMHKVLRQKAMAGEVRKRTSRTTRHYCAHRMP